MKKRIAMMGACGLAALAAAATATAETWKFGLIADTQWPAAGDSASGYKNPNSVAVDIINQVNAEFISQGVKFVIAVGDITDNGANLALDTRATYAQDLYNAGIGFFPLRGNHEESKAAAAEFKRIFPQTRDGGCNNTPADAYVYTDSAQTHPAAKTGSSFTLGSGFSSPSAALSGLSYGFSYNNATFVLLDQFTPPDSSANSIDAQQHWIDSVLSHRPAGTHAFVFGHKGLVTENHADILFSADEATGKPTDDTAGANTFIRSLAVNKVHYYIGGHDHIHNRARVCASNDQTAFVQEVILASDSYKFYKPVRPPNDSLDSAAFGHFRELQIAQDYGRIGYYIVTVDSPRVVVDYYAVPSGQSNGTIKAVPPLAGNWQKRETFGYSLNGREFVVPQGQPYSAVKDSFAGAAAAILDGVNTGTAMDSSGRKLSQVVGTGWKNVQKTGVYGPLFSLWGMALAVGNGLSPTYALSMSYGAGVPAADIQQGKIGLARDSDGVWENAVDKNTGGTKNFVLGPWASGYTLGAYGVDTAAHTAWAVINHGGSYAVADLPQVTSVERGAARPDVRTFSVRIMNKRMILPGAYAGRVVTVDFHSLSGELLQRLTAHGNVVDISGPANKFRGREIIVRASAGRLEQVGRLLVQ